MERRWGQLQTTREAPVYLAGFSFFLRLFALWHFFHLFTMLIHTFIPIFSAHRRTAFSYFTNKLRRMRSRRFILVANLRASTAVIVTGATRTARTRRPKLAETSRKVRHPLSRPLRRKPKLALGNLELLFFCITLRIYNRIANFKGAAKCARLPSFLAFTS